MRIALIVLAVFLLPIASASACSCGPPQRLAVVETPSYANGVLTLDVASAKPVRVMTKLHGKLVLLRRVRGVATRLDGGWFLRSYSAEVPFTLIESVRVCTPHPLDIDTGGAFAHPRCETETIDY